MSVRLLARLFRNGKFLLVRKYYGRDIHTHVLEHSNTNKLTPRSLQKAGELVKEVAFKNQSFLKFGQNARRLFVDNILNRVTNPVSAQLRAEATKKFNFGDSTPFFSLVGVCLASGAGVITKEDEIEGVCWEIREAVARYQIKLEDKFIDKEVNNLQLNNLNIGAPIAKGCSAVVYAASFKDERKTEPMEVPPTFERSQDPSVFGEFSGTLPSLQNTSRFIHNFGGSLDNLHNFARSPQDSINLDPIASKADQDHQKRVRFNDVAEIRSRMSSLSSLGGDFKEFEAREDVSTESTSILKYPLALKMMFNYDIQSNAMSILKAMHKETIPARRRENIDAGNWEKILLEQSKVLPPHPNIVLMFGVFCDQIPRLINSNSMYPMALPPRLNPEGIGRNMSLFLLMKRYDFSLGEFLKNSELEIRTKVVLFAQLLEGVAHLTKHGVAHRDLKSDNILIETSSESLPVLVLSDFGCCIADKDLGLNIPFTSHEMDRGGNQALMAPEIISKQPGKFSVLNYSKSDLWACGTIAYEIFGQVNPFYVLREINEDGELVELPALKSLDYEESELPDLGEEVPEIVKKLVENILQRSPSKRLSADVAANVLQLYLWAPSSWMKPQANTSSTEILQWLLSLTTKVLCEGHGKMASQNYFEKNRRSYTEYLLISSFLTRAKLQRIKLALSWIQANV